MAKADEVDKWLSEIDLATVFTMLRDNGVTEVLYKVLPRNANSKNQVYLASDLSQLGKIPSGDVTLHLSTSEKNGKQDAVFRSALDFHWLDQHGQPQAAPNAKLIFYPQYPEVRFSGFLQGSKNAPGSLWVKEKRGEEPDRILLLGLGNGTRVFGITLPPESPAAKEIRASGPHAAYGTDDKDGVLRILPMPGQEIGDGFHELMRELCIIHRKGWVPSTRLDPNGILVPCNASNCNGNTLESQLGIKSNGYSQPDFRGWEVKARQVTNADRPGASVVTLFTPEPTAGVYTDEGVETFIRRYGYADTQGRADRLNFGGIHRANQPAHGRTDLRLVLDGFNAETGKYASVGAVQLIDKCDNIAAAWPFAKLLDHWKAKHAHAAFVPSQASKAGERQYRFGRNILLGEGAEFRLLLKAFHEGKVYYDPGIKLEGASTSRSLVKKRSQFRVSSKDLPALYLTSRIVDACEEADC
ncbi:MAG: MvaI/BcnI restriction endonuclease family protein [Proteobacteria bacterium]|nr:MvaI/BcnI restriction endonuclease family protein [Pseudomonadota bacterium]